VSSSCQAASRYYEAEIGKSQLWIAVRVRFGRFLDFITTGNNPEVLPKNLTERRFIQTEAAPFWQISGLF
jgi:hypothetical protein